ncbi:MAG: hypothetical protein IJ681_09855 [Bacteroidales bacterium]|nr:hypothetical protein [Bacteroidales bacterium]
MKKLLFAAIALFVVVLICNINPTYSAVQYKNTDIRNKKSTQEEIKVALLLPLFYENIDELSFNEYNIDERRGKNYKCFSYISFYEGARIALDNLEKQGYKVSLYVFDVGENDEKKMPPALNYEPMKDMDLIISLVFRQNFALVSSFCTIHKIPLVNPMSQDESILNNPYVFKLQPSTYDVYSSLLKYIRTKHSQDRIIVIYDDKFVAANVIDFWKEELPKVSDKWTILNYRKSAVKLKNYISKNDTNFVINLTDKPAKNENKSYAQELLNTLRQTKCNIELFASYDWLDFVGNDYKTLQDMNLHFPLTYYNDYTNVNFTDFVELYRDNFKGEPDKIYASLGFDIINYFIPSLKKNGKDFILNPVSPNQQKMISRYKFVRKDTEKGWQNTNTTIYKLENYKIKSCWSF